MSNRETITIERVGPFGVLVDGTWFGIDKECGLAPDDFAEGNSYTVMTNMSKTGKKYIKKVLDDSGGATEPSDELPTSKPGSVRTAPRRTATATASASVGSDRDERIIRQGVYQAVLQSPALVAFIVKKDEIVTLVSEVAESIITKVKGE